MKKILVSSILSICLATTMAVPVLATSLFQSTGHTFNLPGTDSWTRGLTNPGTGYYMAYSYYSNNINSHAAKATIDGLGQTSVVYAPGGTATANSDSRPSYTTASIRASAYSGSWHYVQDTGSGDFIVNGW